MNTIHDVDLELEAIDIYDLAISRLSCQLLATKRFYLLMTLDMPYSQLLIIYDHQVYLIRHLKLDISMLHGTIEERQQLFRTIDSELERSFHYCESELGLGIPDSLVLTPHFARHNELIEHLSKSLQQELVSMDISSLVHQGQSMTAQQQIRCLGAIGGALRVEARHAETTN